MFNFAWLLPSLSRPVCVRSLFAVFAVLSCFTMASSQRRPLPDEAHERPGDPPPMFYTTGVSPGMNFTFGPFTSHQVNVNANGQNITGDAANEPSISVDPTDRNKMTIGWRQFNTVTSNFRQGGYGYTGDSGMTWTFPGVLENNVFRSDPVLFADDTGRFYYNSLIQAFFVHIWRSLDSGQTFTNLQPVGNATGGDKQWYMIENNPSSQGYGFHYKHGVREEIITAGDNSVAPQIAE